MNLKRSDTLMVLSIIALGAFLSYWLVQEHRKAVDGIVMEKALVQVEEILSAQSPNASEPDLGVLQQLIESLQANGDSGVTVIDLNGAQGSTQNVSPNDFSDLVEQLQTDGVVPVQGSASDGKLALKPVSYSREAFMKSYAGSDQVKYEALQSIWPQVVVAFILFGLTAISLWMMRKSQRLSRSLMVDRNHMISNLTHELKTPIATISVALEAVEDFEVKDDKEKSLEYIRTAREVVEDLSRSVDKVTQFVRIDQGNLHLERTRFDLKQLCEETGNLLRPRLDAAEIEFHVDGPAMELNADRGLIRTLLLNLFDNSIKYGERKGRIDCSIVEHEDRVSITVKDDGIGISAEDQAKVFDRFYRVQSKDGQQIKGQGLGLSYAKEIVEAHGGTIRMESAIGEGSQFFIEFKKQNRCP